MNRFQKILYWFIRGFVTLLGLIPRKVSQQIASILGRLWFRLDRRHRNIALENLELAFGREKSDMERWQIAERSFQHIANILFEIAWSLRLKEHRFHSFFELAGVKYLISAYRQGRGVFLLTGHIGNWELLPIAGKMTGCKIAIIYRPLDFLPLNVFIEELRTRFGAKLIPKTHSMRKILRSQQDGAAIATLLDQSSDWYEGVITDFFHHRAFTNKGLALIAMKSKAPVIPLYIAREADHYRVEFGAPLSLMDTGDKTRDIEDNTQIFTTCLESIIRRYPDQWFWIHRRWKNKPYRSWTYNQP